MENNDFGVRSRPESQLNTYEVTSGCLQCCRRTGLGVMVERVGGAGMASVQPERAILKTANFLWSIKSPGRIVVADIRSKVTPRNYTRLASVTILYDISFSVIDPEGLVPTAGALSYTANHCLEITPGHIENPNIFPTSSTVEAYEALKTAADHEGVVIT